MFYLMTADEKTSSVTPYVSFNKKRVLPLTFYLKTGDKKQQCYPLHFIWRRVIKNDSVTPYVLFDNGW